MSRRTPSQLPPTLFSSLVEWSSIVLKLSLEREDMLGCAVSGAASGTDFRARCETSFGSCVASRNMSIS
jgi:hypothetical protein